MSPRKKAIGVLLREAREAPPYWSRADLARLLREAADPLDRPHLPHVPALANMIKNWENGKHAPNARYQTLYCRVTGKTGDELFRSDVGTSEQEDTPAGPSVEEVKPTKRRDALKLGVTVLAPEAMHRMLRDAAEEAMEFTRLAGATSVGAGTLTHLQAVVTELDRAYSRQPPAELFAIARTYRHRVAEMIEGPHTLKQARELYVYAAWLSEALAWLAHDLGDPFAAEAWAIDAFEHADQAGHDELCAWATDAMASIAIYTDRPAHALAAARRGIARAPRTHPLAVRLRAQAARASARLGDREECEELFQQAHDLHEKLPSRAPLRLAVHTGTLASFALTSYPAQAYIWLGDTEQGDFEKAKFYAQSAIAVQTTAPGASLSTSRKAIARIGLGIVLARTGEPEEAAALGCQALTTPRLVNSVRIWAADLNDALIARHPELPVVRDYGETLRQTRSGKGRR
ncbi:hypothetical protein [Actinomadura terrae]|uniref:hypothetical protein n=1 Tax=Actinomadura terrae TaxID=604353 RepID=UPI001FA7F755|nr:hypothetical protein [Actinomadura terrae]